MVLDNHSSDAMWCCGIQVWTVQHFLNMTCAHNWISSPHKAVCGQSYNLPEQECPVSMQWQCAGSYPSVLWTFRFTVTVGPVSTPLPYMV